MMTIEEECEMFIRVSKKRFLNILYTRGASFDEVDWALTGYCAGYWGALASRGEIDPEQAVLIQEQMRRLLFDAYKERYLH